ncbi:hypothetical protein AKJ16_DCAP20967 [Drosera capensis]
MIEKLQLKSRNETSDYPNLTNRKPPPNLNPFPLSLNTTLPFPLFPLTSTQTPRRRQPCQPPSPGHGPHQPRPPTLSPSPTSISSPSPSSLPANHHTATPCAAVSRRAAAVGPSSSSFPFFPSPFPFPSPPRPPRYQPPSLPPCRAASSYRPIAAGHNQPPLRHPDQFHPISLSCEVTQPLRNFLGVVNP